MIQGLLNLGFRAYASTLQILHSYVYALNPANPTDLIPCTLNPANPTDLIPYTLNPANPTDLIPFTVNPKHAGDLDYVAEIPLGCFGMAHSPAVTDKCCDDACDPSCKCCASAETNACDPSCRASTLHPTPYTLHPTPYTELSPKLN